MWKSSSRVCSYLLSIVLLLLFHILPDQTVIIMSLVQEYLLDNQRFLLDLLATSIVIKNLQSVGIILKT